MQSVNNALTDGVIYRFLTKQGADGLLVRNAGGIAYCAGRDVPFVADFSVNAVPLDG